MGSDAELIGNAAAALQGAPVTTVDLDFFFRKTPANLRKLKALAVGLQAVVLRPSARPGILRCSICWRDHLKKPTARRRKLDAIARESDRALRELIRRWQALPPGRRTYFLRKRIGLRGSAL